MSQKMPNCYTPPDAFLKLKMHQLAGVLSQIPVREFSTFFQPHTLLERWYAFPIFPWYLGYYVLGASSSSTDRR